MAIKQQLYSAVSAGLPNSVIFAEYHKRSGGRQKVEWKRQANTLSVKEIKDWKNSVMAATDPENPRRGDLMRFYENIMLDNHLASVIDTRILRVQRSSFKLIDAGGNENVELKQLLEQPWFEDLIRLSLMSRFQGATLIEMVDIDPESLELTAVNEIPQSNFIAHKGLVLKEEYDDSGVDYRSGGYADNYFQVGDNWNLGMLNQLAMIVLAKKLGLGSWMSYVDKFGIPAIFAITDRRDANRRNELFEMLAAYRQNHFGVLEGNEKIEVPQVTENNPHQVFLSLIESVCNREISKRVLGGTAIADEKSFVGAAEVQERVAEDRYEADKLLFKYIFNNHVRKRLLKISPVYAGFDKVTFEWNNQETLNIKDYIDAVHKLAPSFEFDIEEIKARTGLPVTGVRQISDPFAQPESEPTPTPIPAKGDKNNQKKKPDANVAVPAGLPVEITQPGYGVSAATWDAAVEQLTEQIWTGQAKASRLNRDLVLKYYSSLNTATQAGWGKNYFDADNGLTRQFRENLLKFSGAKSYNLIQKIMQLKSKYSDREAYREAAKTAINVHNDTYQWVENKFAANSASAARDFKGYLKDVDIYPCLKNRTMGDGSVRPEHAANEGVIKPVGEWKQTPPYDPGCRCWLEQTAEKPNGRNLTDIDERWANNPALNGELFNEKKHGYFACIDKKDSYAVKVNTDAMKEFMPYSKNIPVDDSSVLINDFADQNDLQPNIDAAKIVADFLKKDVYIRPHIEMVSGHPNPEFGIGRQNVLADLKTMENNSNNFFSSRIRAAAKQGCKYVVMNIDSFTGNVPDLAPKIKAGFIYNGKQVHTGVSKIFIIRNEKIIRLTRKQVTKDLFNDLKKLQ